MSLEVTFGNAAELAKDAHDIITEQGYDYFESGSAAMLHAKAEEIDLKEMSETPLGYTRVPRSYPDDLGSSLHAAFNKLIEDTPQIFMHKDRYSITLGRTIPQKNFDWLQVRTQSPKAGCSLRLGSCDFVKFDLIPKQVDEAEEKHSTDLVLPLGRNVLTKDSSDEDWEQARRDSARDWERTLVVGEAAVCDYFGMGRRSHINGRRIINRQMFDEMWHSGAVKPLIPAGDQFWIR